MGDIYCSVSIFLVTRIELNKGSTSSQSTPVLYSSFLGSYQLSIETRV